MATLPPLRRGSGFGGAWVAALVAATLAAGCVSTNDLVAWTAHTPEGDVCQLVCTWQNSVVFVPDTMHGGTPMPGLAGRLYLFGPQLDFPLRAEGSLVVDVFDESGGTPVMLERWNIDPETFRRLARKDMIGEGYTLFLPWSRYKPDITKVQMRVGFKAEKAPAPVFTQNSVTLAESNGVIREGTPLATQPARKAGPPAGPLGVNPMLPIGPPTPKPAALAVPTLPAPTPAPAK